MSNSSPTLHPQLVPVCCSSRVPVPPSALPQQRRRRRCLDRGVLFKVAVSAMVDWIHRIVTTSSRLAPILANAQRIAFGAIVKVTGVAGGHIKTTPPHTHPFLTDSTSIEMEFIITRYALPISAHLAIIGPPLMAAAASRPIFAQDLILLRKPTPITREATLDNSEICRALFH